ncbi:MAG TPA: type III secretion system cytoplasmic ring protein SctQ [Myxococcales bacterium]
MSKAPASTILESPAAGAISRKRTTPFSFSKLEKVPRAQLELIRRLEWMLPDGLLTGEIGEQVRVGLRRVFDEDVMLWLDYVHSVQPSALKKVMGDPTFLGVIAPTPHGARGLVELDLVLAHSIIDLLLGAPGESSVVRPLTEVEQGVLSYVLLETFKAFSPGQPEPGRHPLRLERIVSTLEEGLQLFTGEATVAIIELKVLIGAAAGYLRLHLPASAIAAAVPPDKSPFLRQRRLKRLQANLSRLRSLKVKMRAEIGQAELTARDIAALRTGDVMIVDELTARADKGEKGTARLRIGSGRAGRIEATVEVVDGTYRATIQDVVLGEESPRSAEEEAAAVALTGQLKKPAAPKPKAKPPPPVAQLGDEEDRTGQDTAITDLSERMRHERKKNGWEESTNVGNKPEDVQADAAELLNDVPLQISVELARVPITAEELVSLHVGKILELGKAPGEPVDLSVNGKVVARGELVEVEGQLGVRIVGMAQ